MQNDDQPSGWIGVDLDGTLAEYDGVWRGEDHIGRPIPEMVDRVKAWLDNGIDVRIFTARASKLHSGADGVPGENRVYETTKAVIAIERWCRIVFGRTLPVTCEKDYQMLELWDDRAIGVVPNRGIPFVLTRQSDVDDHYERFGRVPTTVGRAS